MAELKTKRTAGSVDLFLRGIKDATRQKDCRALVALMKGATGAKPEMWGTSIVGFGSYHYKYASSREADWFLAAFSPRKQNLTLYIMAGFKGADSLLKKMGKHTTGVSCLYVKSLADVDMRALKRLVERSVAEMRKHQARGSV
jgi:hypothetical protein